MFEKISPMFPRLHKCHYCGKRLSRDMPIIGKSIWFGDGCTYDWYCCKECAKAEVVVEKARRYYNDKLDAEIKGAR
jgi:hypothetical protein